MKKFFSSLLAAALLVAPAIAQKVEQPPVPQEDAAAAAVPAPQRKIAPKNNSLLKVNVTSQAWNSRIPWQKTPPSSRRGLGVLLDNQRILVTGQLVTDATYIELELADTGRKLPAKVKTVDYEANLAILVPDAAAVGEFFAGLKPMPIESNTRVGDEVETWQLGRIGDLIVTPMQVNKVVTSRYVLETSLFLVCETLGIIRSEGNSFTLPVIKNGKLAGLLLRYDSKNQSASILPGPIIEHFLKDEADGSYEGFPSLGVEFHQTLDDQFREYLGLKDANKGIYVGQVAKGGSAEKIGLKEGDIILAMNGHEVDARGDYQNPDYGTLNMSHIVRGQAFVGDTLKVKVLRDHKEMELSGQLTRKNAGDYIVPPYRFDRGPNYLVHGGLLFQELSMPFLQSFGEDWEATAPLRLMFVAKHTEEYEKAGRRKIVFLTAALPTRATQGYEGLGGLIVTNVNGKAIKDLADLDEAFKNPQDGLQTIEFEEFPKVLYLDAVVAEADNLKLMATYYRNTPLKRIEY